MNMHHVFDATFLGQYVEVVTKVSKADSTLIVRGYINDWDDTYYYFGHNPIEVTSALNRYDVAFISIINPDEEVSELLAEMPDPETEEDIN